MDVIVTGATGFIGRNVCESLQAAGHTVLATGRNREVGRELAGSGLEFRSADLTDPVQCREAFSRADVAVHVAGKSGGWGLEEDFLRMNVQGTRNVLTACRSKGVGRMVFISTPSVYFTGRHREYVTETQPLPTRQKTHYGRSKLLAEGEVLEAEAAGIRSIILRPRAVIGPHDSTIGPQICRLAGRKRFPLINGGRALTDITYIDNLADAIKLAIRAPEETWGRAYNITNGEPVDFRTFFQRMTHVHGLPFRPIDVPLGVASALGHLFEASAHLGVGPIPPPITRFTAGYMGRTMTLSIARAREQLGYTPRVSNEEGFRKLELWVRGA